MLVVCLLGPLVAGGGRVDGEAVDAEFPGLDGVEYFASWVDDDALLVGDDPVGAFDEHFSSVGLGCELLPALWVVDGCECGELCGCAPGAG